MNELSINLKNLPKHLITSIKNIWRNGVMSISSIFAVTITLLLIGAVGMIAVNIQTISTSLEEGIIIHVKLDRDIETDLEKEIGSDILSIEGVKNAVFSTKDEQLTKLIDGYAEGETLFESYRDDNPLGSAYEVEVYDSKDIDIITEEIKNFYGVNTANYGGSSTNDMISTLGLVQQVGSVLIVALLFLAIFMISNTIKITITTRKVEISIMRMVGASNWYIRIPFMLEGMLIGIIGCIVPMLCLSFGYHMLYSTITTAVSTTVMPVIAPFPFIFNVGGILLLLGSGVGLVGSFISIHKFLKF